MPSERGYDKDGFWDTIDFGDDPPEVRFWEQPPGPPTDTAIATPDPDDGPWVTLWEVVDGLNEPGRELTVLLTGGIP